MWNKESKDITAVASKSKEDKYQSLELIIAVNHLPSFDTFSAADPLIGFYVEEGLNSNKWIFKKMTEAVWDSPNHIFLETLILPYYKDNVQRVKIELWDVDKFDDTLKITDHDYIGEAIYNLSDALTEGKQV